MQRMQQRQHFNDKHRAKGLLLLSEGTPVRTALHMKRQVLCKERQTARDNVFQTPTSTLRRN